MHTDMQTDTQTDSQTHRQTHTDRHTDRHTDILHTYIHIYKNRETTKQPDLTNNIEEHDIEEDYHEIPSLSRAVIVECQKWFGECVVVTRPVPNVDRQKTISQVEGNETLGWLAAARRLSIPIVGFYQEDIALQHVIVWSSYTYMTVLRLIH